MTIQFEQTLLPAGWAEHQRIEVGSDGIIRSITAGRPEDSSPGVLIPGMTNLHSHAHQRAMAGLTERSGSGPDSFWTWRSLMYGFLDQMTPEHLQAIAQFLYCEMLLAGYTRVAEFQYLHNQPDGKTYDYPAMMCDAVLEAAENTGMAMTLLPVHYRYGGFGQQTVHDQQKRFYTDPEGYEKLFSLAQTQCQKKNARIAQQYNIGLCAHSLRAVEPEGLVQLVEEIDTVGELPVHLHIAEQTAEVDDAIAFSGRRPVDWLLDNADVNHRWCLVHATHMTDAETRRLAQTGAVAGLCPTTEANLGDGFFNAGCYLQADGAFGVGSDSHISLSVTEELRWLEYGQRLLYRQRNVLPGTTDTSTGQALYTAAASGGAQACAVASGSIAEGSRADLVALDPRHAALIEKSPQELLDAWIFSANQPACQHVWAGGRQVVDNYHHAAYESARVQFQQVLHQLRQAI